MKNFSSKAYAKINLTLDVFEKDSSNYHRLDSVFQTVSLCDNIIVSIENTNYESTALSFIDGKQYENDITLKAASLVLKKYAPSGLAVSIFIEKKIPFSSGLGGGSSDAGTVMKILLGYLGIPIDQTTLHLAREIGSDVPYFLYGGLCRVSASGENVIKLPYFLPWKFVLIKPNEGTSAKDVYTTFDNLYLKKEISYTEQFIHSLEINKYTFDFLHNDLETAAISLCPSSLNIINDLHDAGAAKVMVSGSGSTVIGFYNSKDTINLNLNKYPFIQYCDPQY